MSIYISLYLHLALVPCGHTALCTNCWGNIKSYQEAPKCPFCKVVLHGRMALYE